MSNKYLIQDKSNILYTLESGGYTENLIPNMTSNTSPSGVVSASSQYTLASYLPWKAFDGVINTSAPSYQSWVSSNVPRLSSPEWIAYEFNEPQIINKYVLMHGYNLVNTAPTTWTFEGSNDNINWDVLDTRTNVVDWVLWTKKEFFFNNYNSYKKYRLNITENNGSSSYVGLQVFEMMSKTSPIINQIEGNLSEDNFIKNGFSDPTIISKDLLINKFGSLEGIKLLAYTDDLEKQECNMVYNTNLYRPIDKLDDEFDIVMLKNKD